MSGESVVDGRDWKTEQRPPQCGYESSDHHPPYRQAREHNRAVRGKEQEISRKKRKTDRKHRSNKTPGLYIYL